MRIKITLDNATFEKLQDAAISQRRGVAEQAEVLLRHSLGLPLLKSNAGRANWPVRAEKADLSDRGKT